MATAQDDQMGLELDLSGKRTREEAEYLCKDGRFILTGRYSNQQYGPIYSYRLKEFRKILKAKAASKWPSVPVCEVLDLEEGKQCVVIGTLYKQMQLKPSILDEYSKERSNVPLAAPSKFVKDDDYLIIEDERGRVRVTGDALLPAQYVTGLVLALYGHEEKDGEFRASELLLPDLPEQAPRPPVQQQEHAPAKYVALLSGLHLGGDATNPLDSQLLADFLTGNLGDLQEEGEEQEEGPGMSAAVVRAVIAGNSMSLTSQQDLLSGQKSLSAREGHALAGPVRELDQLLTQMAAAMPVDVMPGADDPANFSLPQQPLHACLLPKSREYNTLVRATNPHEFEVGGVSFLGTSGQNVDDMQKYCEVDDALVLMENTLRWRHLAPTAPDTLGCYPYQDDDPFLVSACPHVYFCGNQPSYATKLITGAEGQQVRLVCIPRFSDAREAVLLNLATLDCFLVRVASADACRD